MSCILLAKANPIIPPQFFTNLVERLRPSFFTNRHHHHGSPHAHLQGGLNPDFQGIRNYKRQAAYGAPSAPTASVGNSYSSPSGAPSAPTGNSYGRPPGGSSGAPSAPVGDSYGSPNAPPIRYGILIHVFSVAQSPSYTFSYMTTHIGQHQPRIAAGARQQASPLCPIYDSSYIEICNSEIGLLYTVL